MNSTQELNGNEGRFINLSEIKIGTEKLRTQQRKQNGIQEKEAIIGEIFGRNQIAKLFEKKGCVGIKVLFVTDANGQIHSHLVGVDASGNSIYLKRDEAAKDDEGFGGIASSHPCPPYPV